MTSKPTERCLYKRSFFSGFITGVRFYARHLYNKYSIFDVIESIEQTAKCEKWTPLLNFEKTILKVLDERRKNSDSVAHLKEKLKQLESEAKAEIRKRDAIINRQQKQIEELNGWLTFLK